MKALDAHVHVMKFRPNEQLALLFGTRFTTEDVGFLDLFPPDNDLSAALSLILGRRWSGDEGRCTPDRAGTGGESGVDLSPRKAVGGQEPNTALRCCLTSVGASVGHRFSELSGRGVAHLGRRRRKLSDR